MLKHSEVSMHLSCWCLVLLEIIILLPSIIVWGYLLLMDHFFTLLKWLISESTAYLLKKHYLCHTHIAHRLKYYASRKFGHPLIKTELTFDTTMQSYSFRPTTNHRHFIVSCPCPIQTGYGQEIISPAMAILLVVTDTRSYYCYVESVYTSTRSISIHLLVYWIRILLA